MGDRYYWLDVLKEMRQALIRVEADTKSNLGTDAGIWIDSLNTFTPDAETMAGDAAGRAALGAASPAASIYDRYRTRAPGAAPTAAGAPATVSAKARDSNAIDNLDVTFRAVSLASLS